MIIPELAPHAESAAAEGMALHSGTNERASTEACMMLLTQLLVLIHGHLLSD